MFRCWILLNDYKPFINFDLPISLRETIRIISRLDKIDGGRIYLTSTVSSNLEDLSDHGTIYATTSAIFYKRNVLELHGDSKNIWTWR